MLDISYRPDEISRNSLVDGEERPDVGLALAVSHVPLSERAEALIIPGCAGLLAAVAFHIMATEGLHPFVKPVVGLAELLQQLMS